MKPFAGLLLTLSAGLCVHGQLGITGLGRDGVLTWTNALCTTQPVYELLSAPDVTGNWEPLLRVTNATSATVPNGGTNSQPAQFYRVAWRDDQPVTFTYTFSQDLGDDLWCNSVTGLVSLALWKATATWHFDSTELCPTTGGHVTGTGEWPVQYSGASQELKVGSFLQYLLGRLESTNAVGGCTYTRFSGVVMQHGFANDFAIGRFVAERLPP